MLCPLCGTRKARRPCPALGRSICAVCCGTKRIVEIACPDSCGYLASSREHPAAVVRKQMERDANVIAPTMASLTARQHQLYFLLQVVIAGFTPTGLARLTDDDVAEAVDALARTFETASRGVVYEHMPASSVARDLASSLRSFLEGIEQEIKRPVQLEAVATLRSIAEGARTARVKADGGDTAYLALMKRMLPRIGAAAETDVPPPETASSIIIP